MDCVLNRPTCKRTIMASKGPYINEKCPLSPTNQPTCMLAQPICPLLPQDNTCPLSKIMEISKAGGCFANAPPPPPPPPPQNQCCCCCCCCPRQKEDEPVNPFVSCRTDKYVQLPPCQRCRKGYKVEETPKDVKEKKDPKRRTLTRQSTAKDRRSTTLPKPKLFIRSEVEGECTLNSRRPFPCSECLMDLLDCTLSPTEYDSSKVYCKARAVKCPFTQVIDICDENCFCSDIPDIDVGPPCPFAPKPCPCCTGPRCPMTRVPPCPLVERIKPPQCMKPKCRCFCPTVPNPCSITYAECPMHSGLMKNQCTLGQVGGPSVCPATLPQICCCPTEERPSPIDVEVSQEFEIKGKRYTTGNADLKVDVSITDIRKPSAPVQESYQKTSKKKKEITEKHKKERKLSNPLKISRGVGPQRRKSKRKQETLLLRNVERVHNKALSKNNPDQVRISDWIKTVNCSLGTQSKVLNNSYRGSSYFRMAFPKGNDVAESKGKINAIIKQKNKLKHYPDLANEELYKHCNERKVKQVVNKANSEKDVKYVEMSNTTFNKMLMAKALPPPTIYLGDINLRKKMDAPKFCKSPMSGNHNCSCCLKVEGPKQKEQSENAARDNEFITQQSNKPSRYEEEYFYKLKSKVDDPHFKFLTEFCLCEKGKNEWDQNNFNQHIQNNIPGVQYNSDGIEPNMENRKQCMCLKPSGHTTCLCSTKISDLGCVCEPVPTQPPLCECEKKHERNSCPCEKPSSSNKCGCDDCPYSPCPCGKNCPSKLNISKLVKTFHVPTCPQAKVTSVPKSSIKGEKVCPYAPNLCPLGGYCPFPVEAAFDPSAPQIPKPNLICPCKPNKPNCFLEVNSLESQLNCPLSPIKPLSIKEKPVCAFAPCQLGCQSKCPLLPSNRPTCPFVPPPMAPLPIFQNCIGNKGQCQPCCCRLQESRPVCPLSSMAQNNNCFCGNMVTQESTQVSVNINTNLVSNTFDFKTDINDRTLRKNPCNCCPCSDPSRNVCQCNQKPKIKCPMGLEDCPCTHLTEVNACPLNAIQCPVQRPVCPLPPQLRSSFDDNIEKKETIPKEKKNIPKEEETTNSISKQSTLFLKNPEAISKRNETDEAKDESGLVKEDKIIEEEKLSETQESALEKKERKEVQIRDNMPVIRESSVPSSLRQSQASVTFSEAIKILSTDLLNTKYAESMEGASAGKQALAVTNVIKSPSIQKNLKKTRLITGGIRVSPPPKTPGELISDILSVGTTLSKKRSKLLRQSSKSLLHNEVRQALVKELDLSPQRKSFKKSRVSKTSEKNMSSFKPKCLLEPPECPLTGALPSVIAYSGLVKQPGEHLPPPKQKNTSKNIDRSSCTIERLKDRTKDLDCPLKNPPCVMFPEGRCPMKDAGACDCDYPVAPCMLPAQCGDVVAPQQYCYKEECCMGLPLPPTYPAEHGKYETGSYYKFLDWKPGSVTTKHYVDVSIYPPPLTFFKGHPERVHDNWSIIRGGKGYEQCKKIQEIIEARGPVGEVGTQFDKHDNPLDEETILVLENRKNREKLKKEAEKPTLPWLR